MSVLEINGLRFTYGETNQQLFNDAELRVLDGEHIGLVGVNGVGKTTLINLIAEKLAPDAGNIEWNKNISYSYLDQHLSSHNELTIKKYLYDAYSELFQKEEEMIDLYKKLETVDESQFDRIINKASNIQDYLDSKEFYSIKSKVNNVINGLGIDIEENRLLGKLSGGQRAKAFLGKMLLEAKDVLLLDEPTNFLDTTHVDWLSKFLSEYKHAFIVISHNFYFLNSICNVIVSLENKKLYKYKGNYDAFVKQREASKELYEKEYEKQQKFIKKTETFVEKNLVRASTTKQAQSRRKVLEKLERLEKPVGDKKVYFKFDFTHTFNTSSVVIKKLNIGYDKVILSDINLDFKFGEKYVIIGANGIGKTTFIKTLLGIIPPLSGSIKINELNDIVYFEQEINVPDETPIQFVRNDYPLLDDTKVRSLLALYAITGDLPLKSMKELSGGEITKVRFAKLSLEDSNLLILDEPTNHLDYLAKESLFKALKEYPGTVILVSHEKKFYEELNMKEIRFKI